LGYGRDRVNSTCASSHLHDAPRPAAGAGGWRLDHDALARQMLGEWFTGGAAAFKRSNRRWRGRCLGLRPTLGDVSLKVFKLHLQLFDQLGVAL